MDRFSKVPANPAIIKWARLDSKFSKSQAISKIGLSRLNQRRLDEIEDGSDEPTISEVLKFSKVYRRPFAYFFLPGTPPSIPELIDKRAGAGRGGDTKGGLSLAISRAYEIQNFVADMEGENRLSTPQLIHPPNDIKNDPEELAGWVKKQMGIGRVFSETIREPKEILESWLGAVEKLGIIALQETFSPNDASAFSVGDLTPPVLVLCFKDAERRRIFSLFHELAHILLKEKAICEINTKHLDNEERFCDKFAAHFLMPRIEIVELMKRLNKNENLDFLAEKISKFSGASEESAFLRLVDLKYASMDDYFARKPIWDQGYKDWLKRQKKKKGGPNPNPVGTAIRKNGRIVSNMISEAYQNGKISRSEASYFARLPVTEIPKLIQRFK